MKNTGREKNNLAIPTFKFLDLKLINFLFFQINPDTLELVEEEVASCDEILAQEVSNIKEKPSVKEMPSLNLSVNSTPERISQSNENLQIKTPPEQVGTTPNPSLYPLAIQQGGPIFSQKQRPHKKRILNCFLGVPKWF